MSILARFAPVLILFICLRGSEGGVQTPPSWVSGGAAATATKYQTITVDQSGGGNYTTIQSAIDAIPFDNMQWICVYVKTGIYKYNSYNYPLASNGHNLIMPAVAAKISGDKSAFYRCGFMGVQDTLWDDASRHYFKLCSIRGAVDFIMGSGQSIYEVIKVQRLLLFFYETVWVAESPLFYSVSTISVITGFLSPQPGFITAQSRDAASDLNGFVFKDCNVVGNGTTYLGRPWRGHARVLFYNSRLSNIVAPQGWLDGDFIGTTMKDLVFAEDECRGDGSDTSRRVWWKSKLSKEEIRRLTSKSYIDEEGWIKNQAFNMLS
ncbi:putative pectinesterase [Helianthus annuus]|nr:putative pectinesterase [Helianthus annuus]KAJ0900200.1 putative pectinesterase [Helianthus annuus]